MEAYRCAYKDSRSPLTPLTPLTTTVFDFNKLTPTTRAKSPSFLTPNYKTLRSPAIRSAGSKPVLLVSAKKALTPSSAQSKLTAVATRLKSTPTGTRLKPNSVRLKSNAPQLTPTATKLTPTVVRLTPAAARLLLPTAAKGKVVQTTSTSTKKNIERTQYANGAAVVTKYQEVTTTTTSKYEVAPCARLELNPSVIKQVSVYRAPTSPMISNGPCPRVVDILNEIGMSKYLKIFEAEEIDYTVFRMMTEDDLRGIGITSQLDRDVILNAVQYWSDFY